MRCRQSREGSNCNRLGMEQLRLWHEVSGAATRMPLARKAACFLGSSPPDDTLNEAQSAKRGKYGMQEAVDANDNA